MTARARGSKLRRWAISFAAWSAVGVFAVVHTVWNIKINGGHPRWRLVGAWMANMWLWALWTGSLLDWARRLPMVPGRWIRNLCAHVVLCLAYSAASTGFNMALARLVFEPLPSGFGALYSAELFYNVVSYGAVMILAHALAYARQLAERQVRAVELEHELTRAQLAALEMQLRPHFLFNTLHSVAGLIRTRDPDAAIQMISRLSDLLRAVLDDRAAQELPLADELALAARYLEIEQVRFADRLRVAFDIAPAVGDVLVPRLILLPLLENAIRHGVQTREGGGAVVVRAARRGQALALEVVDSGGRADAGVPRLTGHGIGLANTRDRLRHRYGAAHRLDLERQPGGGTLVRVTLPLHHAPPRELS